MIFCWFPAPPAARSTPIHPTQPCRSQPNSQLRNGAKSLEHVHCPHTHCLNHTPHAFKSNPVRNGGSHRHPKLGSLPRGGSSTSSSSSAGPKYSRKLQSNPSITSQSSKRSKSSSKSNSSQIPTEAQDGEIHSHLIHRMDGFFWLLFCASKDVVSAELKRPFGWGEIPGLESEK